MTLPNFITVARFIMVPFVLMAMNEGDMRLAFMIFLVAGLSDGLDGFIARRFDQRSVLGAILDPIADKLLMASVFVMLGYLGAMPVWLPVIVVSRDLLIVAAVGLSGVLGKPVAIRPSQLSKSVTALQIIAALAVLGENAGLFALGALANWIFILAAGLTIASTAAYLSSWLRHVFGFGSTA